MPKTKPPDYSWLAPVHGARRQPVTYLPEAVPDLTGGLLDELLTRTGGHGWSPSRSPSSGNLAHIAPTHETPHAPEYSLEGRLKGKYLTNFRPPGTHRNLHA